MSNQPVSECLSEREAEILRLAATYSNPQIAARLGISPATVKQYLASARDKHRKLSEAQEPQ